jgi:hypothetical protein
MTPCLNIPILACGSMHFGPEFYILIYSIIAGWVIGIILDFVNLWHLLKLKASRRFRIANYGFFFSYNTLAATLFTGQLFQNNNAHVQTLGVWLVFVVPLMTIAHFMFLSRISRKLRSQIPAIFGK